MFPFLWIQTHRFFGYKHIGDKHMHNNTLRHTTTLFSLLHHHLTISQSVNFRCYTSTTLHTIHSITLLHLSISRFVSTSHSYTLLYTTRNIVIYTFIYTDKNFHITTLIIFSTKIIVTVRFFFPHILVNIYYIIIKMFTINPFLSKWITCSK